MQVQSYKHSVFNIASYDPSRTLYIRQRFESAIKKRFAKLLDALALWVKRLPNDAVLSNRAADEVYIYERERMLMAEFDKWIEEQIAKDLEVYIGDQIGTGIEPEWTNIYIRSAYQKGISRAIEEMARQGISSASGDIASAFASPFHVDRLGVLLTRTFNEMKGISSAMATEMRAVLAQGMADGLQPTKIARLLADRVTKIGQTRAFVIARSEVIRAHHAATTQEYRNANILGVQIEVEFSATGDSRMCSICAGLNGKIFSLADAENLIPVHPNCRCAALPYISPDSNVKTSVQDFSDFMEGF